MSAIVTSEKPEVTRISVAGKGFSQKFYVTGKPGPAVIAQYIAKTLTGTDSRDIKLDSVTPDKPKRGRPKLKQ